MRPDYPRRAGGGISISIHAPVKGATQYQLQYAQYQQISIHAPVKGATKTPTIITQITKNFNPRTREGCDLLMLNFSISFSNFNPRTREGCDLDAGRLVPFYIDISIHAPVKGATLTFCFCASAILYFNPRTREGCDRRNAALEMRFCLFQSTHP